MKKKAGETKDNWILLKEKDEYVKVTDGISGFAASIRTGRTMEEIAEGRPKPSRGTPSTGPTCSLPNCKCGP
jgi:bifunctional non-homologous end joining protein LigD